MSRSSRPGLVSPALSTRSAASPTDRFRDDRSELSTPISEVEAGFGKFLATDMETLLSTIRDVEMKLQEPGQQPVWAAMLVKKMEQLDGIQEAVHMLQTLSSIPSSLGAGSGGTDGGGDVANFLVRQAQMIRDDLLNRENTTLIQLQAKVAQMELEQERLQKLLVVRPTVSDMQLVKEHLNEKIKTVKQWMLSEHMTAEQSVRQLFATELEEFHTWRTEQHNLLLGKVERVAQELVDFRARNDEIEKVIEQRQKEQANEAEMWQRQLDQLTTQALETTAAMDAQRKKVTNDIDDLSRAHNEHVHSSKKMQDGILAHLGGVQLAIQTQESVIQELQTQSQADLEATDLRLSANIGNIQTTLEETARGQQMILEGVIAKSAELETLLMDMNALSNRLSRSVSKLEDANYEGTQLAAAKADIEWLKKNLTTCMEEGKTSQTLLTALSQQSEAHSSSITVANKTCSLIQGRLDSVEELLKEVRTKSDDIDRNVFYVRDSIAKMEDVFTTTYQNQSKLSSLDTNVTIIQTNLSELTSTSFKHDCQLEALDTKVTKNAEDVSFQLEDTREQTKKEIDSSVRPVIATVELLRNDLEFIKEATDTGTQSKTPTAGGLRKTIIERGRDGQVRGAFSAMTQEFEGNLEHNTQILADLCDNFEEIAMRKGAVPNIPGTICEYIATISQQLASFVADTADLEVINTTLKAKPEDITL